MDGIIVVRKKQKLRAICRTYFRTKELVIGSILVLIILGIAVLAPIITPFPDKQNLVYRLSPPIWYGERSNGFLLGSDALGRDVLARIFWGAQVSILVGVSSVILASIIGIPFGMIAGIYGGYIDSILMRIADIQLAFPDVLLALAIIATTGPSLRNIIIAIVVTSWVKFARLSRASTLVVKELTYTEGARAIGASTLHIIFKTILPNIITPLIIVGTLQVGTAIITESALSFLGLGIPPPTSTWGGMLAEGREYLMVAWWTSTFPGLAIMVTVLGINLMGNGLRQILDPKLNI
jgi:peptide/nickel transport system permease protein